MGEAEVTVDVLAIGAHPDDVEIGCGGTLARQVARGRRVGILHLTRGEAGTRGDAPTRRAEAEAAAEVLGASTLDLLDCGDGGLRRGVAEEDAIIAVLRRRRPDVVLAPPPRDRHPDHGRAFGLVRDACYYAGLIRRQAPGGEPHRPGLLLSYMLHDSFEPTLLVDVSEVWTTKLRALAAYRSQLHAGSTDDDPDSEGGERSATKIASRLFHEALVGRAHHFGLRIGAEYAEPFLAHGPLAVDDLRSLLPAGLR